LAARLLPSAATQLARRDELPDAETLATRLEAARAGLPFRATAFDAFQEAVRTSRTMPPLVLSDLGPEASRLAVMPGGGLAPMSSVARSRQPD